MRRIAVDAVGAAWRNDLDRRLVHLCVAHLHGTRVRAQQQWLAGAVLAVNVEGVLHRARRVVFRAVQCGEIGPVSLDLGTVGNVEANGSEDGLDALPATHHRLNAARASTTPGQRDIDRLGIQPGLHLRIGQRMTAGIECGLDLFLGRVDHGALRAARVGVKLTQALHLFGHLSGLAQVFRLRVFQRGGILRSQEVGLGGGDELFERAHACRWPK